MFLESGYKYYKKDQIYLEFKHAMMILKKISIHTQTKKIKANPDYFTGSVLMQEITSLVKSKEQKIFHVTFKNGARTKVHNHSGGQILIVTKGIGSLQMYSKLGNSTSKFQIKKIDLVVMGTKGNAMWKEMLMGRVSSTVGINAKCPVLLVK